jgi:hypothetical protein
VKLEREVIADVRKAISQAGAVAFRNNVGAYKDKDGRHIQYGLCKGSSDLIGWRSVEVTQDMVGSRIAVFMAIECKAESGGRVQPEQANFLRVLAEAGGICGVATSADGAKKIIHKALD